MSWRNSRPGRRSNTFPRRFVENALALPCAQQAARSEQRNVGLVGQFLIPDVEFDSSGDLLTDSVGEVSQYLTQAAAERNCRSERRERPDKLPDNQKRLTKRYPLTSDIRSHRPADCVAAPSQCAAVGVASALRR